MTMKKLFILLGAAGLLFSSCEPNEELYEEIEAQNEGPVIDPEFEYTLAPDDYGMVEGTVELEEASAFVSYDSARLGIPAILEELYPRLTTGALGIIHYNVATEDYKENYEPLFYADSTIGYYEVTTEDYDSQSEEVSKYNNFSEAGHIYDFLYSRFTFNEDTLILLDYRYYNGSSTEDLQSLVSFENGEWDLPETFTEDDYYAMGQRYPNFDDLEVAQRNIPIYLEEKHPYAFAGDRVQYFARFFDGDSRDDDDHFYLFTYEFDGEDWDLPAKFTEMTSQFQLTEDGWETDNTVRYALTPADYDWIAGQAIEDGLEEEGQNLMDFGNFNMYSWTEEAVAQYIGERLLVLFPRAEEGQKYLVSYAYYHGSTEEGELYLILQDGVYVPVPEEGGE